MMSLLPYWLGLTRHVHRAPSNTLSDVQITSGTVRTTSMQWHWDSTGDGHRINCENRLYCLDKQRVDYEGPFWPNKLPVQSANVLLLEARQCQVVCQKHGIHSVKFEKAGYPQAKALPFVSIW